MVVVKGCTLISVLLVSSASVVTFIRFRGEFVEDEMVLGSLGKL
jgi:hypothetical protein